MAFEELLDGWNDGFPAYRHPLIQDVLQYHEEECLGSILSDHLIVINSNVNMCARCKVGHSSRRVSQDDIKLSLALQTAFITEDWSASCWLYLSSSSIEVMCTSVPLQLYSATYEQVFDPANLPSWESFLLAIRRSHRTKLEFFRFIVGKSLSAGPPPGSRHRSLLLKTMRAILTDAKVDKSYGEMLVGPLAPELKALCLDCFSHGNNEDAKYIFPLLM